MAAKPAPERIFQVISTILGRKYAVHIDYILQAPGPSGLFLQNSCCVKATEMKGEIT